MNYSALRTRAVSPRAARARHLENSTPLPPRHPTPKALLGRDRLARDQWDAVDKFPLRVVVPVLSLLLFFCASSRPCVSRRHTRCIITAQPAVSPSALGPVSRLTLASFSVFPYSVFLVYSGLYYNRYLTVPTGGATRSSFGNPVSPFRLKQQR